MDSDSDRIARAYARLKALYEQLSALRERRLVFDLQYVSEYDSALSHLDACGYDVREFRVAEHHMRASAGSRVIDAPLLLTKLQAVLTYFEIVSASPSDPKPPMGFTGPKQG